MLSEIYSVHFFTFLDHKTTPTYYKSKICPILEYCSHIWSGPSKTTPKLLDVVQRTVVCLVSNRAFNRYTAGFRMSFTELKIVIFFIEACLWNYLWHCGVLFSFQCCTSGLQLAVEMLMISII